MKTTKQSRPLGSLRSGAEVQEQGPAQSPESGPRNSFFSKRSVHSCRFGLPGDLDMSDISVSLFEHNCYLLLLSPVPLLTRYFSLCCCLGGMTILPGVCPTLIPQEDSETKAEAYLPIVMSML